MADPQKLPKCLSIDEYLALEEVSEERHEYVAGQIFAMTGGSKPHNIISLNIATALRARLKKERGCTVYMADIKVKVSAVNSFYYPDVMVECGAFDKTGVYVEQPIVLFEVLSKSTASTDRREKQIAYRQIPSLKQYVIIHQSRKRLEVSRRIGDDDWSIQELSGTETLVLDSCFDQPVSISMDEIYEDIDFDRRPDLLVKEEVEVYSW